MLVPKSTDMFMYLLAEIIQFAIKFSGSDEVQVKTYPPWNKHIHTWKLFLFGRLSFSDGIFLRCYVYPMAVSCY